MNEELKSEIAYLDLIDFKSNIINSIPGFVFLYEFVDGQLLLKKWNNFHNDTLEYTDKELLNMNAARHTNRTYK